MRAEDIVRDYHHRSSHRFEHYAEGPGALDWDAQPDPFRRFDGCALLELPLAADDLGTPFSDLGTTPASPFDRTHLGILFELSFAISAWKAYGPDRWALRCNPSSGNLHPTEAYAVPLGVNGVSPGIYHYRADRHALERRCPLPASTPTSGILVGLSSVHWREAWKYGERAFRYSQLDTGHAVAALCYAAAALGWRCDLLRDWGDRDIRGLLGLNRTGDDAGVEPESAETLLWVHAGAPAPAKPALLAAARAGVWSGKASLLDPKPMYSWPIIETVDRASTPPPLPPLPAGSPDFPAPIAATHEMAATLIRRRRSAQRFDPRATMAAPDLYRILDATLPRPGLPPWGPWVGMPVRTHLVLFVHRVEGLRPGLYAMPRDPGALDMLKAAMRDEFAWEEVPQAGLPLYALVHADARAAARRLCCHQDIAADSAFAVAMLGEFDTALAEGAWAYRHLFWEAGMIGQALYLQAETVDARGTGIGCYFDPAVHDILGLTDSRLQSMYHFTVGAPLSDPRLQTLPAYPERRD